jgi:CRP-like cAMP-binding protein
MNQNYHFLKNAMKSLSDIPEELCQQLYSITHPTQFSRGEEFPVTDAIPDKIGFNLNGIFRLYYITNDGDEFTKGFSIPGRFVISYSALVQKRPSCFFIEALTDSEVLLFSYSEWMIMIDSDIRWYPFLYKLLETVYIMKEMREKSFLLDDAKSRYLKFREEYPGLEDKIKQYHIASFLGIKPETLSRLRSDLKLT